jgi:energy-coupling factor transporter ATP-binding protein EcfA2
VSFIRIEDVTFAYGSRPDEPALREIDCRIERGSFVGITGASDAGKSSLCRLISGYIPHFFEGDLSGRVVVDGAITSETPIGELAGRVGFVFENPFDQLTGASMTVLEEAAFALENMGLPREEIESRARESLALVGIEELVERHPQQLSGGQSQRLALASVLAARPEIFILDEPTSQLDPLGVEEVFEVVGGLHGLGYTVLVVSQDLERLALHADRLIVMEEGRVRWDGVPGEVLEAAAGSSHSLIIPDTVEVGLRLRNSGRVPAEASLPLTIDDAAREVSAAGVLPDISSPLRPAEDSRPAGGAGGARIVFEDVHYEYPGGVSALRGVSLRLEGGCVCIVGQNGAGKTTLTRHLNGLLRPTRGRVLVRGKDTSGSRVAQLARDVGLAFQNPDDQLFSSTVENEVLFGPRNVGASPEEAQRLADRYIELMELGPVREKKPYDLGLSERKRVTVASVLAMDTPIVVLDEPTGGQDARGIGLLGEAIHSLTGEGKLVIVVAHDVKFACEHADRIIALYEGKVLLDGAPGEVFGQTEVLAKTHVEPPTVARLGRRLGMDPPPLSVDELFRLIRA